MNEMDVKTYSDIVATVKSHTGLTMDCKKLLLAKFPNIEIGTLLSILAHEYRKQMRYNYVKTDIMIKKYYDSYKASVKNKEPSGIIVRIAKEALVSPCLIAKLILTKHYENISALEGNNTGIFPNINNMMKDTCLIQDENLAYEVFLCTIYDDQYSPIQDVLKSSIGQQYEIKLYKDLSALGLAYRDEEYMRKIGYDKTPDVKLEIPIAIDGFIVHWIESKALFGDHEVHKDYIKNQYSSYWNRFGTGLVIYWFGYIETILNTSEKRFIIRSDMPKNIITLGS